jgi:hypothetical protein
LRAKGLRAPGMGMGAPSTLTRAELTAWQELARAAKKLREAQRKAEAVRQRKRRRQKGGRRAD